MHRLPIKHDERARFDKDLDDDLAGFPEVTLVRRDRQCLMCHGQFPSEWSGERICPKCKGGSAWRQGFAGRRCVAAAMR